MLEPGPAIAGTAYTLLALWWYVQVAKHYIHAGRRRLDFHSSVIYPCCCRCRKWPMEGVVKCIVSLVSVVYFTYRNSFVTVTETNQHQNVRWITVFCAFLFSGLCDVMIHLCQRYTFPSLDYIGLVFAFTMQSISMCSYTTDFDVTSWLSVADTCSMFASTAAAVTVVFEFWQPAVIWFSVFRTLCTLVLGTWLLHVAFDMQMPQLISFSVVYGSNATGSVSVNETMAMTKILQANTLGVQHMLLVPMYFTWHCFVDMILLSCLWMVTNRLVTRNLSCCRVEEDGDSHFENRVHFDYHLIDRLESDLD